MPFYTFRCAACGKEFETRCTIEEKEKGLVPCPDCGGTELARVFDGISLSVSAKAKSAACPGAAGGVCPHSGGKCPHSK